MGKNIKKRSSKKHRVLFLIGAVLILAGAYHDMKLIYDGMVAFGAGVLAEVFV